MITLERVEIAHNLDALRAEVTRLEGERVWVMEDWLRVLAALALYNAEARWYDAIRRMNTARRNASAWVVSESARVR